jgi:hypothetical protein
MRRGLICDCVGWLSAFVTPPQCVAFGGVPITWWCRPMTTKQRLRPPKPSLSMTFSHAPPITQCVCFRFSCKAVKPLDVCVPQALLGAAKRNGSGSEVRETCVQQGNAQTKQKTLYLALLALALASAERDEHERAS